MNERYEVYFEDRLRYVREWPFYPYPYSDPFRQMRVPMSEYLENTHFLVRHGIEATRDHLEQQGGLRLRGDAELFLYLSFLELVVMPIFAVGLEDQVLMAELGTDVVSDMTMISNRAATNVGEDGQISMHSIVNAVSQLWSELRTARYQLWDRG